MIATEQEARAWLAALPEWDAVAADRIEQLIALLVEENARQNLVAGSAILRIRHNCCRMFHVKHPHPGSISGLGRAFLAW
jgi:hypothetical protein